MNYTFSDEYTYIPKINGNQDDDDPTEFHCRYMTLPERESCMVVSYVTIDGVAQRRTEFNEAKILKYSIVSIKNLKVHNEDVVTAGQILKIRGLAPMCSMVADFCAGKNNTVDLKN